jgi:hypothetical protein
MRKLALVSAAALVLALPASAHPGPHDDQSAAQLVAHFLGDGFHMAHVVAVLGAFLAVLGVIAVVRSARAGFRR